MFKLKPTPPLNNVEDLEKDRLVSFQHRFIHPLSFLVSFGLPSLIGYLYALYTSNLSLIAGALGGLLIPGVARVVMVQHATFCINSLCHMIGKRPYSTSHSARDSWIAAIFTMGEGYHNYHHEFQWDYRNGVKPWQLDPSKWIIWTLSKFGLVSNLKRVPRERILLAETRETKRQISDQITFFQESLSNSACELLEQTIVSLEQLRDRLNEITGELQSAAKERINLSRTKLHEIRSEVHSMLREIDSVSKIAASAF